MRADCQSFVVELSARIRLHLPLFRRIIAIGQDIKGITATGEGIDYTAKTD